MAQREKRKANGIQIQEMLFFLLQIHVWFSIQGNFYCLLVAKESAKKIWQPHWTLNLFFGHDLDIGQKKTYLEFGKTLDGLKRSQHPQYPQRFDGANVFSLAAPPTHRPHTQTRKKRTHMHKHTWSEGSGKCIRLGPFGSTMAVGGHSLMIFVSELTQSE